MEASGGGSNKLKLYSYWRSSCSFRVRIALNLKGLKYDYVAVDLTKDEQLSPEFLKLNPIGYVPVLTDGDIVLSDSFAILMYLDEAYPEHPLLPQDLQKKAINYQATNIVSSSIQPLQNLAVLKFIEKRLGENEKLPWVLYHITKGFSGIKHRTSHPSNRALHFQLSLEKLLRDHAGKYATGDDVSLADLFLAPQLHAAITRFNLDMSPFPLLLRLHEAYSELEAFQKALPQNQPDAPNQQR